MKILVTGGAGFIGSHTVVELVKAGYSPVIVDNFSNSAESALNGLKNILGFEPKCYHFDCRNAALLKEVLINENIEGVIHFAASKAVGESVQNPLKYYDNNLGSTITLLELMVELGIKNLVFSSSCTVYGEPEFIPVTEQTPRQPATSPYGSTKVMCEDILRDTAAANQIHTIALRYFNPIGAHETAEIGELPNGVPSNLIPFVTQTAAGIREKLTIFGNDYDTIDGTNVRDYIHVVDLAKAHVAAFSYLKTIEEKHFYDTFNVGTGAGNSVLEVVKAFEKVNGVKVNYEIGLRRSGDVEKIYGNVEKANQILGWKTEKTLEESLKDAWRWQKKVSKIS
jgi:UDP-glucose 4-epimerase